MIVPTLEQFVEKAHQGNLIPIYREILADMETPVSAFRKLEGWDHAFLLESVEGGDRIGRYSFVGGNPFLVLKTRGREVELRTDTPASPDDGVIADYTGHVHEPGELAARLSLLPGVVDHGLFPAGMVSAVLVGRGDSVERS